MPMILTILNFLKKILLFVWQFILYIIRLFIPECKADQEYCLKFDQKGSYGISLALEEEFDEQNRLYEQSIHKHFQEKLDEVYIKQKKELSKHLKKAIQGKKNKDMKSYNDLLVKVQTQEANIQNNYYLSIDQHRLIIQRERENTKFRSYKQLHTSALHASTIFQEALI